MNFLKSFLFFSFFIMFHGIFYAMEHATLSPTAQELTIFFKHYNIPFDTNGVELIERFNKKDSGTPLYVDVLEEAKQELQQKKKISWKQKFKNIFNNIQEGLFGYSFSEWKSKLRKEWAHLRGRYASYDQEERKESYQGRLLLSELRKASKIPQDIKIPVFESQRIKLVTRPFVEDAGLSKTINKDSLQYAIFVDAEIHKKLTEHDFCFNLAHELSHAERGDRAFRNLLGTKILSGIIFGLVSYSAVQNREFRHDWIKPSLYGLSGLCGVLWANRLKYFYKQIEEKNCDLRAIEICSKANKVSLEDLSQGKGLGLFYYLTNKPELECVGKFLELKANNSKAFRFVFWERKYTKFEQPTKYSKEELRVADHPSPYERVRCCIEHSEKLRRLSS